MVRLFEIALNGFGAESSEILNFGTWGSYGNQYIHITPDENWEGLVITAYFRLDNAIAGDRLFGEDMTIDIPPAATAKPTSGSVKGKLIFRGTQEGRVIITTDLPYFVSNHSDTEESDNKYTPDQWSQFVSQVDASRKAAEAASAQASKSAAQAAQSLSDTKQVESNVIYQGSTAVQNIQSSLSAATAYINAQTIQSLSAIQNKQDEAVASISEQVGEAQKSASLAAQYASNAEASANAAAENASKVQQEVESGISAIGDATESAKSEIQTAKTAAVDAVNQTKTQAVSSVITQQNSSIQAVQAAQNTAVQAVQAAQTTAVGAVNDAGNAKIEQIEQINSLVPTPTPEDAGKVVVVKPDGTGYELGDAGSEIDDTVVAPDSTWSSLNIVNKLCPPFSVTGDMVQFNPVEGYPLSVQSTIVATQSGEGDPSPTNVRPIVQVEQVGVWVGGKNLLNLEGREVITDAPFANTSVRELNGNRLFVGITANNYFVYSNVVEYSLGKDWATVKVNNNGYGIGFDIPVVAGIQLTVSAKQAENVHFGVGFYDERGNWLSQANGSYVLNATVPTGAKWAVIVFRPVWPAGADGVTYQNPQVEIGPAATAYEPYRGQLYTAQLDEPCYGGTVDLTGGTGEANRAAVVVTGDEKLRQSQNGGRVYFHIIFPDLPLPKSGGGVVVAQREQLCNLGTIGNPYDEDVDNCAWVYNTETSPATLRFRFSTLFNDAASAKTQLKSWYEAGTPLTVAYDVSAPTPFTIAPLSIPAPASPAKAYSTAGEITVSGRSDPIEYINQQIANAIAIAKA